MGTPIIQLFSCNYVISCRISAMHTVTKVRNIEIYVKLDIFLLLHLDHKYQFSLINLANEPFYLHLRVSFFDQEFVSNISERRDDLFSLLPVITWLCCLEMVIWACVCSLCLSNLSHTLPTLSVFTHLSHISVFVPGRWHNTDGPGSDNSVDLKQRSLLWLFSFKRKHFVFCQCLLALIETGDFCSLRILSFALYLRRGCIFTLYQLLCGIWQRLCCSADLIWLSDCEISGSGAIAVI